MMMMTMMIGYTMNDQIIAPKYFERYRIDDNVIIITIIIIICINIIIDSIA